MMRKVATTDYMGRKRSDFQTHRPKDEKNLVVQSDAHLADINNIMRNFEQDGIGILDEAQLQFADISHFTDYHDLMMQVREAETAFMKLPSKVREIFDHSVERWLDTAHDEDKRQALVEAGFIKGVAVVEEGSSGGDPGADLEVGGSGPEEVGTE